MTVQRRNTALVANIGGQISTKSESIDYVSVTLDESTDTSSTALINLTRCNAKF